MDNFFKKQDQQVLIKIKIMFCNLFLISTIICVAVGFYLIREAFSINKNSNTVDDKRSFNLLGFQSYGFLLSVSDNGIKHKLSELPFCSAPLC